VPGHNLCFPFHLSLSPCSSRRSLCLFYYLRLNSKRERERTAKKSTKEKDKWENKDYVQALFKTAILHSQNKR